MLMVTMIKRKSFKGHIKCSTFMLVNDKLCELEYVDYLYIMSPVVYAQGMIIQNVTCEQKNYYDMKETVSTTFFSPINPVYLV